MTRIGHAEARRLGILPSPKIKTAVSKRVYTTKAQWDARVMPGGIMFIIPENMPSLNVWKQWHWAKQQRFKNRLDNNLNLLALTMGQSRFERARVEVVHYHRVHNRHDADNYAPKFLLDALRWAGVLVDDNEKVLELPEPRFEVDKERFRTEIYVYELW